MPPRYCAGNAASVRFIRNTPGLVPLAERQASKLRQTPLIERRLVQAIVAQASPLAGGSHKRACPVGCGREVGAPMRSRPLNLTLVPGSSIPKLLRLNFAFLCRQDNP